MIRTSVSDFNSYAADNPEVAGECYLHTEDDFLTPRLFLHEWTRIATP